MYCLAPPTYIVSVSLCKLELGVRLHILSRPLLCEKDRSFLILDFAETVRLNSSVPPAKDAVLLKK